MIRFRRSFSKHCVRDDAWQSVSERRASKKPGRELWLCVRDPFWQERFSNALLEQASLGFDLTHIDQGHAAACYCDICRPSGPNLAPSG